MKLTLDNPASVPAPFGDRFAHLARVSTGDGALLLLSGQVAVDETGAVIAAGDVMAQTTAVFGAIREILAAHGATLADVAHIRTFLLDLNRLGEYGQARRPFFPGPVPPASTTVQVGGLFLPGAELEVEVTAVVGRTG